MAKFNPGIKEKAMWEIPQQARKFAQERGRKGWGEGVGGGGGGGGGGREKKEKEVEGGRVHYWWYKYYYKCDRYIKEANEQQIWQVNNNPYAPLPWSSYGRATGYRL